MVGNLVEALGPAALRFLRPIRVVGGGGCSYLGFSFCIHHQSQRVQKSGQMLMVCKCQRRYLLVLIILAVSTLLTAAQV